MGPTRAALVAILSCLLVSRPGEAGEPPRIASQPVIEIVATPAKGGERLRIEALVTTDRIRRVEFVVDGELVGTDRRFPFGTVIRAQSLEAGDSETGGPAGTLEGIAFDRDGREIARDRLELDRPRGAIDLSLAPVRRVGAGGWLEVAADIRHPEDVTIDRVDFYRDDRYVATVGEAPYRVRIRDGASSGYLRAVALARDGSLAEEVRLIDESQQAEQVSVSLVELYAMVTTRAGTPVTGLDADQFVLRRRGRALPIERFSEGDEVPLSVALVMDGSGSMLDDMERAKQLAGDFLTSALDEGDHALLVDFDSRPRLLRGATDDVADLPASFDAVHSGGSSSIYEAILFASLQLEEAVGRRALVVVTDGLDTGSRISPRDCAAAARRRGVPVFVLALEGGLSTTPSHRRLQLRDLALDSGGGYYPVHGPRDFRDAYDAIETRLRGQYLLGFSSPAPLSDEELDTLTVELADERLTVHTLLGGQIRVSD